VDVGAGQPDRAAFAGGDGLEPAEEDILVDLQDVGVQGGTGVVAQRRVGTVQVGEVGAEQPDRAKLARANGLEFLGVQRFPG
jgi:hypothetical protein